MPMPWHQFWKRKSPVEDAEVPSALPPHMQNIVQERKRPAGTSPDLQTKLTRLERNRLANLFDIEQGELAVQPDNPWYQRIQLLTEAMATVQTDITAARVVVPSPYLAPPDLAIDRLETGSDPVASVQFRIGTVDFRYEEDLDWSERGHQLAQSELSRRAGSVSDVIPTDSQSDLRAELVHHLDESLFVFASDMRDRTIDQMPLPDKVTLSDLAKPCPVCGGWTDWLGRCQACRQRDASLQALKREENRLLTERGREAEEQHRLKERLPIARRRLRDIDAEITEIQSAMSRVS